MPGRSQFHDRKKAVAGRDAAIAGRDQVFISLGAVEPNGIAAPGMLPRDMPGFTGRDEELGRLAELAERGSVTVAVIGGPAGVGKTALAVNAAHRLLPRFPDGHLYADLRGYTDGHPAEPGEVLEDFLRRLGVPAKEIPRGVAEQSGLLRSLLASRRALILLDNAASETQIRPLLPGAGGSMVIVTSRSVLPGLEVDERIRLDVLAQQEATALLAVLIGPTRAEGESDAVEQVRQRCGDLPLALRIAGQILAAHPLWPVAMLVEMLNDEQNRLDRLTVGDLQVRAAFLASYRQLPEEDARMFRLLGLHPGGHFQMLTASWLAGTDPESAIPA